MALYALVAFSLVALALSLVMFIFSVRDWRERRVLWQLLSPRREPITLAWFLRQKPPEATRHVLECYTRPDDVNLEQVLWHIPCMPTPYLNYAPIPGRSPSLIINGRQMRDQRELALPRPPGVYRIFLSGGSVAFSLGAPNEDTTLALELERLLNERGGVGGRRVEVFCAAVPGYTSTHERIMIENRLSEWEPDLVVALTGINDCHWGFMGREALDCWNYEDSLFFSLANMSLGRGGADFFPQQPPYHEDRILPPGEVAEVFIKNFKLAAAALDVPLVVALQPYMSERFKPLTDGEDDWLEEHRQSGRLGHMEACFDEMAQRLGELEATGGGHVRTADLRPVFKDNREAIFIDIYHFADRGNQVLARRLLQLIEPLLPHDATAIGT